MVVEGISTKNAAVKLTVMATDTDVYWRKFSWKAKGRKLLMVCNYPASLKVDRLDLTTMLILNNAMDMGFGSVVIANLFTRPVKSPRDKVLEEAFSEDSMAELVAQSKTVDQVIIGIGSLINKSKTAKFRLDEYQQLMTKTKIDVKMLVSPETKKPNHPLALQRESWLLK